MTASEDQRFAEIAAVGALHLFTGRIISRAMGLIGGIVIIRILGFGNYGILTIALVLPGILVISGSLGIQDAVTKYLSEHSAKREGSLLSSVFFSSLLLQTALLSILSVLCYLAAESFASVTTLGSQVAPLIKLAALLIPGWTLYSFAQSALVGLDATKNSAVLMVIQEALGAGAPILLVVYGLGVSGAILGNALAFLAAALLGVLLAVRIAHARDNRYPPGASLKGSARRVLFYGFPLGMSGLVGTAADRYFGFLMAVFISPEVIGSYSAAGFIVATISFLTVPISTVAVPLFSKATSLDKVYGYAVKYSSLIILPSAVLLTGLSRPLVDLLFGGNDATTAVFVSLLAATWLAYGLGAGQYLRLFTARGDTRLVLKLGLISLALGVILGSLLIRPFGIVALILSSFLSSWPSYVLSVRFAKSKYGIRNPARNMSKLYVAVFLMLLSLVPLEFLGLGTLPSLVAGVVIGTVTYIVAIPRIGGVTRDDVVRIEKTLGRQPFLGVVLRQVLSIMKAMSRN